VTEKQMAFIKHYVLIRNATQAAIKAGYKERSAPVTAHRLLDKPAVKAEISRRMRLALQKSDVGLDRIVNELAKIAFYDIKSHVAHMNEHGVTFKELKDIDGNAIASINEKLHKDGIVSVEVRTHSKVEALKALLNHFGQIKTPTGANMNLNINVDGTKTPETAARIIASYRQLLQGVVPSEQDEVQESGEVESRVESDLPQGDAEEAQFTVVDTEEEEAESGFGSGEPESTSD